MASLNLVQLYLDVFNKKLVNVGGSPTSVPDQYYGDKSIFTIYPVQQIDNNPAHGYQSVNLAGSDIDLVMAGTPNAQNPPTPFVTADGLTWQASPVNGFVGFVDLTQPPVGAFIGANAQVKAYFNIGVFDINGNRTTLYQATFNLNASIDTVTASPPGPITQYFTAQQILNRFVQIGAVPNKIIVFQSQDGTKTKTLTLGNDGTVQWN